MPEKAKPQKPEHLFDFTEVLPHLFVAGFGCVTEAKLKQHGITHLVDATNLGLVSKKLKEFEILEVPIADDVLAKISKHFEAVVDFVNSAKAQVGFWGKSGLGKIIFNL
ncbi:unnamed protein product, partial [Mesorhabditis spiculigera]